MNLNLNLLSLSLCPSMETYTHTPVGLIEGENVREKVQSKMAILQSHHTHQTPGERGGHMQCPT